VLLHSCGDKKNRIAKEMNHVIMSKNVGKYGSLLFPKRRGTAISGKGIGLCLLQVLYCSPLEVEMNGNPQRNLQQKYAKI
jgi:hypothetical protein